MINMAMSLLNYRMKLLIGSKSKTWQYFSILQEGEILVLSA